MQYESDGSSKRTRGWRDRKKAKEEQALTAERRRAELTAEETDANVTVNVHREPKDAHYERSPDEPVNVTVNVDVTAGERRGEHPDSVYVYGSASPIESVTKPVGKGDSMVGNIGAAGPEVTAMVARSPAPIASRLRT